MAQKSVNAPRETELPSEEQRVADNGSRNHRGEGEWKRGHWEQKGAGGLFSTRIGQGYLFHIDVQVPPFYKTLDAFLDSL